MKIELNNSANRIFVLFSATFFALTGCATEPADKAPTTSEELRVAFKAVLEKLHDEAGFPGATAAYILPDGTTEAFAIGLANKETGEAMTSDAIFLSASNGKMYVGAVAASLAEEGALSLDDPVKKWLGDRQWYSRLPNDEKMTVRMLLNHSSGVIDHVHNEEFLKDARERIIDGDANYVFPPEQLVSYILDKEPSFPAGESFQYSDTGFILAGLVIEAAAGEYYEQLNARILTPFNLDETLPANRRDIPGLVQAYRPENDDFGVFATTIVDGLLTSHPLNEWTGGGLASSAKDLAKFTHQLLHDNMLLADYAALVEANAVDIPGAPNGRYGLGLAAFQSEFGDKWGHGGWFPGYKSDVGYYPEYGITVAIMINTDIESQSDARAFNAALTKALVDELK